MDLGSLDKNPPYFRSLNVTKNGIISSYAENGSEIEFEAVNGPDSKLPDTSVSIEAEVNGITAAIQERGNKKFFLSWSHCNR